MKRRQQAIATLLVFLVIGSAMVLAMAEPAAAQGPDSEPFLRFGVISDSHVCNPFYPPVVDWVPGLCPPPPSSGGHTCACCCQYQKDRRRTRLEDAMRDIGAWQEPSAALTISLGDAIEDRYWKYLRSKSSYLKRSRQTARSYWKYASCDDGCYKGTHHLALGNHDIRDSELHKIYKDEAYENHIHWAGHYGQADAKELVKPFWVSSQTQYAPWYFVGLHSGEAIPQGSNDLDQGSCVRFTDQQIEQLDAFLGQPFVWAKHAILFWHVSPMREIRGDPADQCKTNPYGSKDYKEVLKKHSGKIAAIFTGHLHTARAYIWNPTTGELKDTYQDIPGEAKLDEILIFEVPSTGFPEKSADYEGYDHHFVVDLFSPGGGLNIINKTLIDWQPMPPRETTTAVFGESRYTAADACFEQDNDGDGWFDDDKIDCPGGTYMGTELDYNSDRQTFTIGADLWQSCTMRDYTQGQYYAVSNAEIGEAAQESITISQHYGNCIDRNPPISELDPETVGGGVAVVVTGPDGVARQIANVMTHGYTDHASGISVVSVEHNDFYTQVHLENLPEDYQVSLYVEFTSGLKGEFFSEPTSCDAVTSVWLDYIDPEFAEDFALEIVDNNAPPSPTLTRPPNGTGMCDSAPSFGWMPVNEVDAYHFQVDDDDDFSSAVIDSEVSGTSFAPAAPLPVDSYYWRVRSAYECGHGSWSSDWNFNQLDCVHLPIVTSKN